ncbi:MAG: FIST C-terminal domain-containing protein [Thiotrichales bacterium]|nr:FIST C-terminal domain-containing protein [Thiotrichales bacterium]
MKSQVSDGFSPDIVFMFGDTDTIKQPKYYEQVRARYPQANIMGSSTSGNILGAEVSKSSLVLTAVSFDSAQVKLLSMDIDNNDTSEEIELELTRLVNRLTTDNIKQLFVLSDGLNINGSQLLRGLNKGATVSVTGGLAGDGNRFEETFVIANAPATSHRIAILAFYGDSLTTSDGYYGGWSEFGAERIITKSKENIVYEIDGKPALDLYKNYLGEYAEDLPNSGLRFPLSINQDEGNLEVIRTLLAIDEEMKSITFAGDVPQGCRARLMKPDLDILVDGAGVAAKNVIKHNNKPALSLVVSCVGRKIIMGQMVEEELEALERELGTNVQLCGFYSYGEISPISSTHAESSLHNQTIALTTIYED